MPLTLATHWGPFHADDVLAGSLIRVFLDPDARVLRSRDEAVLASADIVYDVGSVFDPATRRFDHHQQEYEGPLSSAGMVLDWLEAEGSLRPSLAARLRRELVDFVDAVDNGRQEPIAGAMDYTRMVDAHNAGCDSLADFDAAYGRAVDMTIPVLRGIGLALEEEEEAERQVLAAMASAAARGSNAIVLDRYLSWKPTYFANGGAQHPTEFVVFPGVDDSWRAVAIAPQEGSFDQKRPFPESWAGLRDEALAEAAGVPGARFCHKNRFIAVWGRRQDLLAAMARAGLLTDPTLR